MLARCHGEFGHAKQHVHSHANCIDTSSRTLLSQVGPQVNWGFFKLSITFWFVVVGLSSETKKRPMGSPLPAVVSTLDLASTPRGKGESAAVPTLQI